MSYRNNLCFDTRYGLIKVNLFIIFDRFSFNYLLGLRTKVPGVLIQLHVSITLYPSLKLWNFEHH